MTYKTTLILLFSLFFLGIRAHDDSSCSDSDSSDSSEGHGHHHHGGGGGNGGGGRNHGCGSWKYFSRPSGGWCMQVFAGRITQSQAIDQCAGQGARLSGIQNAEERAWILRTTQSTVSFASGAIWIGAERRPNCIRTTNCGRDDSFQWTDGSATGTSGYRWNDTQPDNSNLDQNCAQLIFSNSQWVRGGQLYEAGTMDDIWCGGVRTAANAPRETRAYVCGKKSPF